MEMRQKNKNNFIMDTDWLFDGILDAEQKQYVFFFGEVEKPDKQILGGKGANLAEMTSIGLPVPG
jgi:hypothetical protein